MQTLTPWPTKSTYKYSNCILYIVYNISKYYEYNKMKQKTGLSFVTHCITYKTCSCTTVRCYGNPARSRRVFIARCPCGSPITGYRSLKLFVSQGSYQTVVWNVSFLAVEVRRCLRMPVGSSFDGRSKQVCSVRVVWLFRLLFDSQDVGSTWKLKKVKLSLYFNNYT